MSCIYESSVHIWQYIIGSICIRVLCAQMKIYRTFITHMGPQCIYDNISKVFPIYESSVYIWQHVIDKSCIRVLCAHLTYIKRMTCIRAVSADLMGTLLPTSTRSRFENKFRHIRKPRSTYSSVDDVFSGTENCRWPTKWSIDET